MRLRVLNREAFQAQVNAFVTKARVQAETRIRGIMVDAQRFAADHSPVYSGDYASNWNVSAGSPDTNFNATPDYLGPEYPEPKDSRWGMGNFDLNGFRLGQTVYLTNAAEHDEPYAWLIEDNQGDKHFVFREPNKGKHGVGRATAFRILRSLGV